MNRFKLYVMGRGTAKKDEQLLAKIYERIRNEPLEVLFAKTGTPEKRYREATDSYRVLLEEAGELGSSNAAVMSEHLQKLIKQDRPVHGAINILGNILTDGINKSGLTGGIKLQKLDSTNPYHTPEAMARCMFTAFEMGSLPLKLKDKQNLFQLQTEILGFWYLDGVVEMMGSKEGLETDMAMRFPGAKEETVKAAAGELAIGTPFAEVQLNYRELQQKNKGHTYWHRWRAGYGLIS